MIGQSGWIDMASSRFIRFFFLLVIAHKASTLNCGWPGKPNGGILKTASLPMPVNQLSRGFVPSNRVLSYEYLFQEGQIVSYECYTDRRDVIRGTYLNRTCNSDGRWSGTRPWCDLNVAYGKTVTYTSPSNTMSDTLMTDGLIDSSDPINGAECATLGRSNAYFSVDLGDDLPVRVVGVFGKAGEGMNNLVNKRVTLGTSTNCPQKQENSSAFGYECNREQSLISSSDSRGNTVRFEHGSGFVVDICEVLIYANPTVADCGEPEIPAFGEVAITTGTTYQEATYHCRDGYELQGQAIRRCNGRSWDGVQPVCVEVLSTTTRDIYGGTTEPNNNLPESGGGGLDPFQIVLIVVCVALAIGLIVALIVLLKFGRLSCCGSYGSTLSKKTSGKKKPIDQHYQQVTTNPITPATTSAEEASKRAAAMAAAEREREERDFNTRLAYQNEMVQQSQPKTAPKPKTITYAELTHEPAKRVPDSPMGHSLSDSSIEPVSPIYAQVHMRSSKTADNKNDGISAGASGQTDTPPVRKSYIPSVYLKESPEVQMKQQALNDQLKQAVRISRNTDF